MRNGPRSSLSSSLSNSSQLGRLSWFCFVCWVRRDDEERETDDVDDDDKDEDEADEECTRTLTRPLPSFVRRVSNDMSSALRLRPKLGSDSASTSESNSSFVHSDFDLLSSLWWSTSICTCETAVDEEEVEGREDERARGRPAQSNSQSSALSVVGSIADDVSNAEVEWTSRKDEAVGSEEEVEDVEEERREGRAQRRTCG